MQWGLREYGVFGLLVVSGVLWSVGVVDGREVYPAPVLPSFGGIPEGNPAEALSWEVLVSGVDDQEPISLTASALFPDVPDSQWDNLFNSTVDNSADADVAEWIVDLAEELSGVDCSTEIVVRQVSVDGNASERHGVFRGSCD